MLASIHGWVSAQNYGENTGKSGVSSTNFSISTSKISVFLYFMLAQYTVCLCVICCLFFSSAFQHFACLQASKQNIQDGVLFERNLHQKFRADRLVDATRKILVNFSDQKYNCEIFMCFVYHYQLYTWVRFNCNESLSLMKILWSSLMKIFVFKHSIQ